MAKVVAIVAMDQGRVIGMDGGIPWRLPEDLRRFSSLTSGHTVVMGRKTYDSLPTKYRPLPNRLNVVITRDAEKLRPKLPEGVQVSANPDEFLQQCKNGSREIQGEIVWVIGGEELYRLLLPQCDEIELTQLESSHDGDAFFPSFEDEFVLADEEKYPGFSFQRWQRR